MSIIKIEIFFLICFLHNENKQQNRNQLFYHLIISFIGQKIWIPKASASNNNLINVYIYKVKWGDTLEDLALRFNVTIWDIASLNRIYDLNRIYTGQSLYIPVK